MYSKSQYNILLGCLWNDFHSISYDHFCGSQDLFADGVAFFELVDDDAVWAWGLGQYFVLRGVERLTDGDNLFDSVFLENGLELTGDGFDTFTMLRVEFLHVLERAVKVVDDRENVFENFCGAIPGSLFALILDKSLVVAEIGEGTSAGFGHLGELGAEEFDVLYG